MGTDRFRLPPVDAVGVPAHTIDSSLLPESPGKIMKKALASLAALALALCFALVASAPATATTNTNDPAYWQTPSTGEVCAKIDEPGGKTWSLSSVTLPANSVWTKVIIKSGNTGTSVDYENAVYYTSATYKFPATEPTASYTQVPDLTAQSFGHPSGKDISHVIYCYAPSPVTTVAGGAGATDQACTNYALVAGFITVQVKTGVSYVITNSSNVVIPFDAGTGKTAGIPGGSYTVAVSAASGYTLGGNPSSIPVSVGSYNGYCGLTTVAGGASATSQVCTNYALVNGVITVEVKTGVNYVITNSSNVVIPFDAGTGKTAAVPSGTYTVTVSAASGYTLGANPSSIPVTVTAYDPYCGLTPVTPHASVLPQTCPVGTLVGGSITVTVTMGIVYTIKSPANAVVPFTAGTGKTGPLTPGTYTVEVAAASGYSLTSAANIPLIVQPYGDSCGQLITDPLVTPAATMVQASCSASGSYSLSNDQTPGAVVWRVNGVVTAEGQHSVTTSGPVTITVTPTTGYGFAFDQQAEWDFSFGTSSTCADLKTLAFTGSDASPLAALAAGLGLLGIALLRARRRERTPAE